MNCKICKKNNFKLLYSNVVDPLTNKKFDINICDCGFAQTKFLEKNIGDYYPKSYRDFNLITNLFLSFFYKQKIKKWSNYFKNAGSILEIGCGPGFMLKEFENLKWDIYGTERNKEQINIAKKNTKHLKVVNDIDDFKKNEKFDLIILFHVLEHVDDPIMMIEKIKKILKRNGILIISVPNLGSWQSLVFKNNWYHLDVPRHLFHFEKNNLLKLLNKRFTLVNESFISFEHDPIGWLESFLNVFSKQKNFITKYLSSSIKLNILKLLICLVLFIPSILLSIISWKLKKGATVEFILRKD